MKFVLGTMLAIVMLLGAGGAAVLAGVIPVTRATTTVQAVPPLQPLDAQTTSADMIVTLSERFMNQQLTVGIPPNGQVQSAQLDLHAGNTADFTATIQVNSFISANVKANVLFSVVNGRIVINIYNVSVGGFGVPASLIQPQINQIQATAEAQLNQQFANVQANTGLQLQTISTTENSITLSFAP
ncbi:MAG TPA: hypothetical protein VFD70_13915 [Anaerolineae bacterium]|nr:hypothetical protein [Anaerolineae bacterium]